MNRPLVTIASAAARSAGACYGVTPAGMLLRVRIADCAEAELARIERGLADILQEEIPPRTAGAARAHRVADLFAFSIGAIQRQSRVPVSDRHIVGRSVAAGKAYDGMLVLPAPSGEGARTAIRHMHRIFNELATGAQRAEALEIWMDAEREKMVQALQAYAPPGVNTFLIFSAAQRLGIPVQVLCDNILVLGCGSRSRWMDSTLTDETPAISARVARSKHLTSRVLIAAGLPGGVNRFVHSADEAVQAAGELGYPAVVKPSDRERGEGVSADLRTPEAVRQAFAAASELSQNVLVERFARGSTHRLTVFQGRVLRVMRRVAGGVTGDGTNTIARLVEIELGTEHQQRARRRHGSPRLALDEEALGLLEQEGLTVESVPEAGRHVRLRRRDNINAGGRNETIPLEEVHPDNLRLAIDAASVLRLDVAGIDLITEDVRQSWREVPALICEINAQPQFGVREPDLYDTIVGDLVGGDGRIPARLVILAADDASEVERRRGRLAAGEGLSAAGGLWVGGQWHAGPFEDGFHAARALLRRLDVSAAVCIMTVHELRRHALPMDRWDAIEMPDPARHPALQGDLESLVAVVRPHLAGGELEMTT